MPTYEYECKKCGDTFEVFQKMSDDPLEKCEKCGGSLRKLFSPVGIVFKGSGFYVTDSRKNGSTKSSTASSATAAAPAKTETVAATPSASDSAKSSSSSPSTTPTT